MDLLRQVTKAKQEKSFYSLPEFEEWKSATDNWHTWKVKYYKGFIFLPLEKLTLHLAFVLCLELFDLSVT